ncbi:unnamed protein product, partial [Scytosiphon promiscuus]
MEPERTCRGDTEENGDRDERQLAFLRARIVEAAREGDTPEVNYLVGISSASRLLSAVDETSRWSLLHFSCSRGFVEITLMLLDAGAEPLKAVDKHGKTCLHVAIEHDRRDLVELLLERYPVGKWPRKSKLTLGQTAAKAGRRTAMQMLLRNGLDPNDKGIRRETPLHQASRHGHAGVVELLLQHGADVAAREAWAGRTPLHYACQSGSLKAATTLIVKGGADPHLPDLSAARHTPLEAAVVSGHRALSHRLVVMVDNRLRAEQNRLAKLESLAVASGEVTRRETQLARHRVSSLRGKVVTKRSLIRLEKQQLADTLRGHLTRANARLRNLQTQHERLRHREEDENRRPKTCPSSVSGGWSRGAARVPRR